jgi:chemotaxis signal transduction protein
VLQVTATEVTSPPKIVKGLAAEYIAGIVTRGDRTIIVLNGAQLLSAKEKLALEVVLQPKAKVS